MKALLANKIFWFALAGAVIVGGVILAKKKKSQEDANADAQPDPIKERVVLKAVPSVDEVSLAAPVSADLAATLQAVPSTNPAPVVLQPQTPAPVLTVVKPQASVALAAPMNNVSIMTAPAFLGN